MNNSQNRRWIHIHLRESLRALTCLAGVFVVLGLLGCGAPSDAIDPEGQIPNDPPCSCQTGARRCVGKSVQVCEQESATCSSWGALVACPSGRCEEGSCKGDCQDSCPAGISRCGADGSRDVCRIGASGCLDWVRQDCPAQQYCDIGAAQCQPVVSCEATCPKGYSCRPTGVCAGGMASDLVLDVIPPDSLQVRVAGRITLNGAAPRSTSDCSATRNPEYAKATVQFTDKKTGLTTDATLLCKDAGYEWVTQLAPGSYMVRVQGAGSDFSNLPEQSFVADPSLVVSGDITGKVLDVKTLSASGRITLNGAAPRNTSDCSATMNPAYAKTRVEFYEKTYGYRFDVSIYCRDSAYAWTQTLFPGNYTVRVQGAGSDFSNLPEQSFVADPALVVSGEIAGKVLDVRTLPIVGRVTRSGMPPKNGVDCSKTSNPGYAKAQVLLHETTLGYQFEAPMYCRDSTYEFKTSVFPGTYAVSVSAAGPDFSNLPNGTTLVVPRLQIP